MQDLVSKITAEYPYMRCKQHNDYI